MVICISITTILKRRGCLTVPRLTLISLFNMLLVMHSFPTRRSSDLPLGHARGLRPGEREPREMAVPGADAVRVSQDRKSTRLNSSHTVISYAVFCLKKKNLNINNNYFKAPWMPDRTEANPNDLN